MKDLSVIIVNYNVKYFLDQCLASVRQASKGLNTEIIVVDNNSVDGSVAMIKEKYPEITLIENKENRGFSVANNQALRIVKSEYVLLLNPDTIVQEDTFHKCLAFMRENPEAGALTVKMIDGNGRFLRESKRAIPTPATALFKMIGLASVFKKSPIFAKYYLGHLPDDQIAEIQVMPGAFMFIRTKVLDKTGLLDEDFFMYGEDIDLSYRILKAGYKIFYYPRTTIIHYKGESTKKQSLNYVIVFYKAMMIFVRKHFSHKKYGFILFFIRLAIVFSATIAAGKRFLRFISLFAFDFLLSYYALYFTAKFWAHIKFNGHDYDNIFYNFFIPSYIIVFIIIGYLTSIYSKKINLYKVIKSSSISFASLLILYSLLPEQYRYSRLIIIAAFFEIGVIMALIRYSFGKLNIFGYKIMSNKNKKAVILSSSKYFNFLSDIVQNIFSEQIEIFHVSTDTTLSEKTLGSHNELKKIIKINDIDYVFYNSADIDKSLIINMIESISDMDVEQKIIVENQFIISSKTIYDTLMNKNV